MHSAAHDPVTPNPLTPQPLPPQPVTSHPVTAQSVAWRDPDAVVVSVKLTLRELTALYAVVYLAHAVGGPVTSTVAACEGDAAAVLLHRATCKLYVELRNSTCRGGL